MTGDLSVNALLSGCEVLRGTQAVERNLDAVQQIYEGVKTSYGPLGLDKMCVDASGTVLVTNDGATILQNMLVEDPTARILVNLALEQDKEVGDGTTTIVLLAANLVKFGAQLIKDGVHPSVVVSGYRIAFNECIKYIKNKIAIKISKGSESSKRIVDAVIKTAISSKIINQEEELFIRIVKEALENVLVSGKYHVEKIKILKALGGSLADSEFSDGVFLNCNPASKLMAPALKNPRVLCLDFSLNKERLPLTANIRITDPEKIEAIKQEEIEITKRKCQAIINAGATVILTTGGIDEIFTKMFVDSGIVAVKRCAREDLLVIAEATGTELYRSLVTLENDYQVEGLGTAGSYELRAVGDNNIICFTGCKGQAASVLLRGSNTQVLDEAERALNDALQILKRTLESRSVVPGGGAVEVALSFLLEDFSSEVNCREHVAVHRFSQALLELPKILATNAGLDADKLVADLMRQQYNIFKSGDKSVFLGLDVMDGSVQDNIAAGIVEPAIYKLKVLKAATEAAIAVLRIDEIVVFPSQDK